MPSNMISREAAIAVICKMAFELGESCAEKVEAGFADAALDDMRSTDLLARVAGMLQALAADDRRCGNCDCWGGASGSRNICVAPVYDLDGQMETPYNHYCAAWQPREAPDA